MGAPGSCERAVIAARRQSWPPSPRSPSGGPRQGRDTGTVTSPDSPQQHHVIAEPANGSRGGGSRWHRPAGAARLTAFFILFIVLYVSRELPNQSISFYLNTDSGVPAYLQLAQQVRHALRMGVLKVGDKLPTVKEVVAEVAVNANTVMKAYWELEHEGLVEGRQGVGTFVSSRPAGPPPGTQARLARSLEKWVQTARHEGLDDESIESLLISVLRVSRMEGIA